MKFLKFILFFLCIFSSTNFICACNDDGTEYKNIQKFIGLDKQETWLSLLKITKTQDSSLLAKNFSRRINTKRKVMLNRNTTNNVPEIFMVASKWIWSSPATKYIYLIVFNEQNRVSEIRREKLWK